LNCGLQRVYIEVVTGGSDLLIQKGGRPETR
jgi:hypothetical protein